MTLLFTFVACRPELADRPSLIDAPRVLAVRAEPAESYEGASVRLVALVGGPAGMLADAPVAWSRCEQPKGPIEPGSVSTGCLSDEPALAMGTSVDLALSDDACALFGPETPPGDFRPRDPDVTGGYYQPLLLALEEQLSVQLVRLRCNLANAPIEVVQEFERRYVMNGNPQIQRFELRAEGEPADAGAVPGGAELELFVTWNNTAEERYVLFDPATQTLLERNETMRVSFYITAGELDSDVVGKATEQGEPHAHTFFRTPDQPGPIYIWAVLRDDRGGVDYAAITAEVVR